MDLGGIQSRLLALGVSLQFDSDSGLGRDVADEAHSQREYRAALYVDRLEAARTFLTTTLARPATDGGLGAGYRFVAAALTGGDLLNQLAESLDQWVCPAVEPAVNAAITAGKATDYTTWFTAGIFDPSDATYQTNVRNFFAQYPITDHAITQITANFQNNIRTALRRVLADRAAITALFSDRYNSLTLTGLSQITSTGSDFHKGGQQVLILTFTIRYWYGYAPIPSTLKLVYKPGDVEIDCLITGESAAINRAAGNQFQVESLVEIFNAEVTARPARGLEPLPTYRILPRSPVSEYQGAAPYPVRQAYGYLEYLSHAFTGRTWSLFNYYPFGASDYVIFRRTDEEPVIEKFYHQAGQFLALAATFSMIDLHVENVRATAYQPRFIDLEASLTAPIAGITSTALLDTLMGTAVGGFNGSMRDDEKYVNLFLNDGQQRPYLEQQFIEQWYDNRLWALRPNLCIVPVNAYWLLQGLTNGMNVIRAIQNSGGFTAWLDRARDVLVRILPLPTKTWNETLRYVYARSLEDAPPNAPVQLGPTVTAAQISAISGMFAQGNDPEPKYMAAAAPQVVTDLTAFDVPTFYHRVGSLDLLDSDGGVVPLPQQVTIFDQAKQPVQVSTNMQRNTYFAAAPTAARVGNQLRALTGAGFAGLLTRYSREVLNVLGHQGPPPQGPGVLI